MSAFISSPLFIPALVVAAALIIFIMFKAFWKVAGTNEVLIVSGMGKVRFEFISRANVSAICRMISERVL